MVFTCPHCIYPLVSKAKVWKDNPGEIDAVLSCSNCQAILRITIVTLKEPKTDFKKNNSPPPTTNCFDCTAQLVIGKEHEHVCPNKPKPIEIISELKKEPASWCERCIPRIPFYNQEESKAHDMAVHGRIYKG